MAIRKNKFKRILIANRGEIALRIQRACRELSIETVQVYSEVDKNSMPVRQADFAVCIGHARSSESYLCSETVMQAAKAFSVDAIHPGYGFLSENSAFAKLCKKENINFIGPSGEVISTMGDKASARAMAVASGMPVTPGSSGVVSSIKDALEISATLGYPVILKAVAGGGGRGMRIVEHASQLTRNFEAAAREAKAFFGNDAIYVEKYLKNIRHIEIQILSDGKNFLNLGERDCSSQRRNQKLVEESPALYLHKTLINEIGLAAINLCKHVNYTSAGTVECIVDNENNYYFMEMNTRIQVEHPVTEYITGIDIIKEQIKIAEGNDLMLRQEDIVFYGHAVECRINAENSDYGFTPCPGLLTEVHFPGGLGVRIDSHVFSGYVIPSYYDSLIAKLICWGRDREEALARMRRVLQELSLVGVKTTAPFLLQLINSDEFKRGDVDTSFVEKFIQKMDDKK